MTNSFIVKLYRKSGSQGQFSFRVYPGSYPKGPSSPFAHMSGLYECIEQEQSWTLGGEKYNVELSWNGVLVENSRTTLSYYYKNRYMEFNLNSDTSIYRVVEPNYMYGKLRNGKLRMRFEATFDPAAALGGLANINLTPKR